MNYRELTSIIPKFKDQPILVVGDLMIDEYLWGNVERISPEAPVQIVDLERTEYTLGGAGNTVRNLTSLGARVYVSSVVDNKENGSLITEELAKINVCTKGLFENPNRVSSRKTRVMAGHQQVLRIDKETRTPIERQYENKIIDFFKDNISDFDAIIVSDYMKGILTEKVLSNIITTAKEANKPIIIDPKGADYRKYVEATIITPNEKEAELASGITIMNESDLKEAGIKLLKELKTDAILITRGSKGMSLFEKNGGITDIPAVAREVYDVTGAGDTVVSMLGLGLATGLTFDKAATLSNIAAGIVVEKVGAATVTVRELEDRLDEGKVWSSKIKTQQEIVEIIQRLHKKRKKIVFTNGCFDLLHIGHIKLLQKAKMKGDILIVGLNSDSSVQKLKGKGRPIITYSERAQILSALDCVDYVVKFVELIPLTLIKKVKPDVLVKGNDYSKEEVVGKDIVEKYGGRVELVDFIKEKSSSRIAEKIKNS